MRATNREGRRRVRTAVRHRVITVVRVLHVIYARASSRGFMVASRDRLLWYHNNRVWENKGRERGSVRERVSEKEKAFTVAESRRLL